MTHVEGPPDPRLNGDVEFLPARARTAADWLGLVFAVVLIASGAVLVHDTLVHVGVVSGQDWITTVTKSAGVVRPGILVAVIGLALAVLGLLLVFGAFKPRRRLGAQVAGGNGQYLLPRDLARLASAAAKGVDGVLDARSSASTGKVFVLAHITGAPETSEAVHDAVQRALSVLDRAPQVRVRTRSTNEKDESR